MLLLLLRNPICANPYSAKPVPCSQKLVVRMHITSEGEHYRAIVHYCDMSDLCCREREMVILYMQ